MNFKLRDQQQIEHTKTLVVLVHNDGPAGGLMRKKIGMAHQKCPTVRGVNGERIERRRPVDIAKLLDGHMPIIT